MLRHCLHNRFLTSDRNSYVLQPSRCGTDQISDFQGVNCYQYTVEPFDPYEAASYQLTAYGSYNGMYGLAEYISSV